MNIRKATISDLDEAYNLLNDLYENRIKYDIFKKLYNEKISDKDSYYVVMENDNKVVAILIMYIRTKLTRAKKEAYVESIIVNEEFRNNGIGRKLLQHAIDYAKALDCEVIDLSCVLSNEKGQKFYEEMGFKKHSFKYRQYMNEY